MLTKIKVGASKRCINPPEELMPYPGYGGVREGEDINVRTLVIDNGEKLFLIAAWELGGAPCPDEVRAAVEEKYGIAQENMLISGTHNHHAPHTRGKMQGGPPPQKLPAELEEKQNKFSDFVIEQSVIAVGEAIEAMRPANYGYGEGKSYVNINRDQLFYEGYWMQGANYEGCSDKTVSVLKFTDDEGNLIAAVANYAMHSTTSFMTWDVDGKVKITCDIPGIAANLVEEHFGNGAICLWQSGAAGNQNPNYVGIMPVYTKDGKMRERRRMNGAAYEQGVALGQQHGIDIITALEKTEAKKEKMRITSVDDTLLFPTQKFPEGKDWNANRLMADNLEEWAGVIGPDDPLPVKDLAEMIPSDELAPMKAQLILFGDVAYYGVACELYNDIAMLCKEASPYKHLVITTHIGTPQVGYILDDAMVGRKVFQSFGLVPAGRNNAIVVDGMLKMFDEALLK